MYNKKLTLSNGVEIPQLGLGTQFIDDDKVADAVKAAADLGYRHFDTAQAYGNERGVGEGIHTCGIPREELFVVSKVAAKHKTYEDAKASIDKTLSDMGLDYLDIMIIHSPQPWVEVNQSDKAHTDTLILFQLEVSLPFKGFAFLRKAPLDLLLPFSGQILIISPHLPHSGLFVLDNRHLSHILVCGQSVDSFHKILRADTPFYCHKSFSLKFCIQPPYQLISIGQ